ncbi:hypothetical protein OCGS_1283 [Oceaniovalibus guishaninsula JLT2003]|uniref:Cell division coordinator CpoB n=1 Tax=Oceaniovalibus guishaninsula JLT2003 TaxID=1231392 RepID=K2I631_9RHOB|nr:tol-pal system protein YbgF [Oceaniovalibus guishaninsula]EKE44445.1 hypothetical protein OCGS_1283 [Oceaniovalibus guishaninsula JLT2003]
MIRTIAALALAVTLGPAAAVAQDGETLADIQQELSLLLGEVQGLRRELSTTGTAQPNLQGTGALERIDAMEAELRRLTSRAEEIEFRVNRVVTDGTNRIGDLQFRLCELEPGCDIGALGSTPPLGGETGAAPAPAAPAPATGGAELAVGEQQDFDRAKEALDSGSFRSAADLFQTFTETYTGGPLTGEAHFYRGQALAALEDTEGATRAYLDAFSSAPDGVRAADALLQLGLGLEALGQRGDACLTLGEVPTRYPSSSAAGEATTARAALTCP